MADKGNDPAVIWQTMMGEMEKGFNSFGNQLMTSPEFSRMMNQAGGAAAGAQRQLGELMEKYLLAMNLPSRAQLVGMAERIQSIEGQLNEIKSLLQQVHHNSLAPEGGHGATPRPPPRTSAPAHIYVRAVRPQQIVQIHEMLLSDIGLFLASSLLGEQGLTGLPLTVVPAGESLTV